MQNAMKLTFSSLSENEAFARNVVATFILNLNPTVSELNDVKTAVSEAVTNAIVHGYPDGVGEIELSARLDGRELYIEISDDGVGISDVKQALEPCFTTGMERSGMGFTVMQAFMDEVNVDSAPNKGTRITMLKKISEAV